MFKYLITRIQFSEIDKWWSKSLIFALFSLQSLHIGDKNCFFILPRITIFFTRPYQNGNQLNLSLHIVSKYNNTNYFKSIKQLHIFPQVTAELN